MPFSLADYQIGWICALPVERALAQAMLDKLHPKLPTPGDDNAYTFGEVHFHDHSGSLVHNVVLACLPSGLTGKASAATVAKDMERTFASLKFGLMIGIAGGVWSEKADVRLGDIVVGMSEDGRPGVVQYDHGKTIQNKELELKGTMNKAPRLLLSAVSEIQGNHLLSETLYRSYLDSPRIKQLAPRPDVDELYDMTYVHQDGKTCYGCDKSRLRTRSDRLPDEKQYPTVHYGVIASGDQVMKDAITAEKIRQKHNTLCFEMEAAGLDAFKCLVIRGISDYADTHKNDDWHRYAAAAAVSYAKELLGVIAPTSVSALPTVEHRNTIIARLLPKLYVTDPRSDKQRLVDDKGELHKHSIGWLLQDSNFKKWRDDQDTSLLWLKGTPGKGKTMMCVGIIDELALRLRDASAQPKPVFFFCQNQYSNLNNPVSVLKGLLWLMVEQQPFLIEHLAQRIASKGQEVFEGPNSLYELWSLFEDILESPSEGVVYILVDALDECDQGRLDVLLKGILKTLDRQPQKVKWLLTSRPSPEIEQWLEGEVDKVITINLDANKTQMSEAVTEYIESRVGVLAVTKHYDHQLRRDMVSSLQEKAEETFLWVSLVCQRLETVPRYNVKAAIAQFPKGLVPLFERMLHLLLQNEDEQEAQFCVSMVRSAVLAWNPIHIKEIGYIAGLRREISDDETSLRELVNRCGSFLKVSEGIVSFIHQSVREYLGASQRHEILSLKPKEEHLNIAIRCLDIMLETLQDNMGALDLGSDLSDVRIDLVNDMVARCGYSTRYWMEHVVEVSHNKTSDILARIEKVLRVCFLRWCEILSLTAQLSVGRKTLEDLRNFVLAHPADMRCQTPTEISERTKTTAEGVESALRDLVVDAMQFYTTYTPVFSQWPLQVYCAALVFSPESSQIRRQFRTQHLKWLSVEPRREDNEWSKLQVLEGHSQAVSAVTFSPDGKLIASGSLDKTIRIWMADVGIISKTLSKHSLGVTSIAFSPDSKHIASASDDTAIIIWAVTSGDVLHTLHGHSWGVSSVSFCRVSDLLASASHDGTIRLWNAAAGASSGVISSQRDRFSSIALSADGKLIVSIAARDRCVKLWKTEALSLEGIVEGHEMEVSAVASSPDGTKFASASKDKTVKIWDSATRTLELTLANYAKPVTVLQYSYDGQSIATVSADRTVKLWESASGSLLAVFSGHTDRISSVGFSPDGKVVASASWDRSVILWNATGETVTGNIDRSSWNSSAVALSPDCRFAASAFGNPEVTLWSVATGRELHRFKTRRPVWEVSFTDDQACVHTNQGSLSVEHFIDRRDFSQPETATEIDVQDQWIIWRKQKVMWLPREYRTTVFAARKSTVVLACRSGRVVMVDIDRRVAKPLSGVFG